MNLSFTFALLVLSNLTFRLNSFGQELPINIQSLLISKMLPYCKNIIDKSENQELNITVLFTTSEEKSVAVQLEENLKRILPKVGKRSVSISNSAFSGSFSSDFQENTEVVIFVSTKSKAAKYYESALTKKGILTILNYTDQADEFNTVIALGLSEQSKPLIFSSKNTLQQSGITFSSDFLKIVKFK